MGDALCSFNPIYGQGMSVAALEAVALQDCLRKGNRRLGRRFMKAACVPVDHAWKLAGGSDLEMPEVEGRASLPHRIVGRYMNRMMAVAEPRRGRLARVLRGHGHAGAADPAAAPEGPPPGAAPWRERRQARGDATVHALPVAAEPVAEAA
jgi:hypothetical protein